MKEHLIKGFISKELPRSCYSALELKKTPLGEKILIYTSRPGLVVGGKGANVQRLTEILKRDFQMENPQIEVVEIDNPNLDPLSIADKIVSSFERFGPKRFKSLGYSALQDILNAGALGAEIVIGGRDVPSSRARKWRFLAGHLKKSGDISESYTKRAHSVAHLRSGSVGVKVSILTPDIRLPDNIIFKEPDTKIEIQELPETEAQEIKQQEKLKEPKKRAKKQAKQAKKEVKKEEPEKKEEPSEVEEEISSEPEPEEQEETIKEIEEEIENEEQ